MTFFEYLKHNSDDIVAFFGGSILSIGVTTTNIIQFHPLELAERLIIALLVGMFGGIGGIAGKELCAKIKRRIKVYKEKRKLPKE